jgi:hypothetical protein
MSLSYESFVKITSYFKLLNKIAECYFGWIGSKFDQLSLPLLVIRHLLIVVAVRMKTFEAVVENSICR